MAGIDLRTITPVSIILPPASDGVARQKHAHSAYVFCQYFFLDSFSVSAQASSLEIANSRHKDFDRFLKKYCNIRTMCYNQIVLMGLALEPTKVKSPKSGK